MVRMVPDIFFRALPYPAAFVTCDDQTRRRTPGSRHLAGQAVTSPTKRPISIGIHDDAVNGKQMAVNRY